MADMAGTTELVPYTGSADVRAVNDAINKHKMVKDGVLLKLLELSREAEGLVLEKINQKIEDIEKEMKNTEVNQLGRCIQIVCGAVSLILSLVAAPVSLVLGAGLGSIGVGFCLVGKSVFQIMCKKEKVDRFLEIQTKLFDELKKYEESQAEVFTILEMKMDLFTENVSVKETLKRISRLVENTEDETDGACFTELSAFLVKVKGKFSMLAPDKKTIAKAEDILVRGNELLDFAKSALAANRNDKLNSTVVNVAGVAASPVMNAVVNHSGLVWGSLLGLSMLINGLFLINDSRKLKNLEESLAQWKQKKEEWEVDREKLLKSPEFEKEVHFRNLIVQIRDQVKDSY